MRRVFVGVSQSTAQWNGDVAGQAAGGQDEVLVLAAHAVRGLRGDDLDGRVAEPADEVEVVGGEVLDDADVADAVGERAAALGRDEHERAELVEAARGRRAAPGCSARRGRRRRGRPARSTAAMISRASSAVAASGFSTRTWTPSPASRSTQATCSSVGTATIAKSGRAARASRSSSERVAGARVVDGAEAVAAGVDGAGELDAGGASGGCARGGGRSCRGRAPRRARRRSPSIAPVAYFACPPVFPPRAAEPRRAARRPQTWALGVVALGTTDARRRGRARARLAPRLGAAADARPTTCSARPRRPCARPSRSRCAGYRGGSTRENALLNLLGSFTLTFGIARALDATSSAAAAASGRSATTASATATSTTSSRASSSRSSPAAPSVVSRNQELDPWLALPFGAGVALTLDESALLLELDDVYWTERGVVSLQITLGTLALLSSVALALRVLRRGEADVLEAEEGAVAGDRGDLTSGDPLGDEPPRAAERARRPRASLRRRPRPAGRVRAAPREELVDRFAGAQPAEWWQRAVAAIIDARRSSGVAAAILARARRSRR